MKYNPFKFFSLVAYILPVFDDIDNTSKKDNGYWELIISNPPNHANIKEVELSPHFACYQRCQSVKLKKTESGQENCNIIQFCSNWPENV